ncbi:M48 family metallopeptidase [Candidatus Woesearchaeota archaeon]|nr:M48 family metallopeptidase [Candidatus Woesearchaeota archaeon]
MTKLGHYEYATDTISISTALKEAPELLDYVLYHEMLHKKHKFTESKGGNTRSHTKAFRDEEKKYRLADGGEPEKRLATFLGQRKRRKQGISFKIKDWF